MLDPRAGEGHHIYFFQPYSPEVQCHTILTFSVAYICMRPLSIFKYSLGMNRHYSVVAQLSACIILENFPINDDHIDHWLMLIRQP